jgi:putative phosphoserine phosphatase/1-acylglycerol-3-phosphate O-acyltransferase
MTTNSVISMARATKLITKFDHYLEGLKSEPDGEKVVVYFDLDRTLIAGYSITALALEKMWSGSLSPKRIIAHAGIFLGWGLGRWDYHQLLEATVQELVGMTDSEMVELGERAFERRLKPLIYEEARRLIDAHKTKNHEVAIITSATRYQAVPIARALGIDEMFCTEVEVKEGIITGNVVPCYGIGKKVAAEQHMLDCQADFSDAFFYTDSCEDLPLLEVVGRPVVANGKTALSKLAATRGWPQLLFETVGDTASAIAA